MLFQVILLILSILGLIALFTFKYYELNTGKVFLKNFRESFDGPIKVIYTAFDYLWIKFNIRTLTKKIFVTIIYCIHIILDYIKKSIEFMQSEIKHAMTFLKGKKVKIRKGAPSFFVKHIVKYKEKMDEEREKMNIRDSL